MIAPRPSLFVLLGGLPLGAVALELPEPVANALVVTPPAVTAPADAPEMRTSSVRLRDSLRQPLADGHTGGKPYRLSTEERQRLRELLRGQPDQAAQNR